MENFKKQANVEPPSYLKAVAKKAEGPNYEVVGVDTFDMMVHLKGMERDAKMLRQELAEILLQDPTLVEALKIGLVRPGFTVPAWFNRKLNRMAS